MVGTALVRGSFPQGLGEAIEDGRLSPRNLVFEVLLIVPQELKVDLVFFEGPAASGDSAHINGEPHHLILVKVGLVRLLRSRSMALNNFSSFPLRFDQWRKYGLPSLQAQPLIFLTLKHLNLLIISPSLHIRLKQQPRFSFPRPFHQAYFPSDPPFSNVSFLFYFNAFFQEKSSIKSSERESDRFLCAEALLVENPLERHEMGYLFQKSSNQHESEDHPWNTHC